MIQMTNLSSYDDDAIHLHKSNEIETLDLITTPLNPLTILVVEDASNGFIKKKITIGELESGISDLDAIHLHKDNEISTLEPAPIIFDHTSLVVIEDAADNYSKHDKIVNRNRPEFRFAADFKTGKFSSIKLEPLILLLNPKVIRFLKVKK